MCTFVTSGHVASIVFSRRSPARRCTAGATPWAERTSVAPSGTSRSSATKTAPRVSRSRTTWTLWTICRRTYTGGPYSRSARSTVSTARSTPAQYPRGEARRTRFTTPAAMLATVPATDLKEPLGVSQDLGWAHERSREGPPLGGSVRRALSECLPRPAKARFARRGSHRPVAQRYIRARAVPIGHTAYLCNRENLPGGRRGPAPLPIIREPSGHRNEVPHLQCGAAARPGGPVPRRRPRARAGPVARPPPAERPRRRPLRALPLRRRPRGGLWSARAARRAP